MAALMTSQMVYYMAVALATSTCHMALLLKRITTDYNSRDFDLLRFTKTHVNSWVRKKLQFTKQITTAEVLDILHVTNKGHNMGVYI